MSKMLKRRTSVNHLYQAATMVVNSSNTLYDKMVEVRVRKYFSILLETEKDVRMDRCLSGLEHGGLQEAGGRLRLQGLQSGGDQVK